MKNLVSQMVLAPTARPCREQMAWPKGIRQYRRQYRTANNFSHCCGSGSGRSANNWPSKSGSCIKMYKKFNILWYLMISSFLTTSVVYITTKMSRSDPRSVIQDYGSKDPDPKEIFTDPQHWFQRHFSRILHILTQSIQFVWGGGWEEGSPLQVSSVNSTNINSDVCNPKTCACPSKEHNLRKRGPQKNWTHNSAQITP